MEHEQLAAYIRVRVLNGADAGRVGLVVDTLEMEELFGGWGAWFRARMGLHPRRRWRATWVVVSFLDGTEGAFRYDELQPLN